MINKTKRLKNLKETSTYGLIVRRLIKDHLKKNRLTYKDAADVAQVSLATFKRLMTKSDFSLGVTLKLLSWMGKPLPDIWKISEKNQKVPTEFKLIQEKFLATNPIHLYSLILIMKGLSSDEVAANLKFSLKEFEKILFKLDRLNLIKVLPKDNFRIVSMGPFHWKKSGPLEMAYYNKFCQILSKNLISIEQFNSYLANKVTNRYFKPFEFYLKDSTFHEFRKELENLINKFHSRAILEADASSSEELLPVSGILSMRILDTWREVLLK